MIEQIIFDGYYFVFNVMDDVLFDRSPFVTLRCTSPGCVRYLRDFVLSRQFIPRKRSMQWMSQNRKASPYQRDGHLFRVEGIRHLYHVFRISILDRYEWEFRFNGLNMIGYSDIFRRVIADSCQLLAMNDMFYLEAYHLPSQDLRIFAGRYCVYCGGKYYSLWRSRTCHWDELELDPHARCAKWLSEAKMSGKRSRAKRIRYVFHFVIVF